MKRNMLWVGVIIMIMLFLWGVEEYRSKRSVSTITQETGIQIEQQTVQNDKEGASSGSKVATEEGKLIGEGNFRQTGTLINYDSVTETESENWRLLYDKPGSSVRQVNLTFESSNQCNKLGISLDCNGVQFINGDRVELVGVITGGNVEVVNMRKAKVQE